MSTTSDQRSDTELDQIFVRRIRPVLLDRIPPSSSPTAIVVGSPPGVGKAFALAAAHRHMLGTESATASVSADELRAYHPDSQALATTSVAAKIQQDVGRWYVRLIHEAMARRVDMLIETSMREPDAVVAMLDALRQGGYRTGVAIVAMSRDESRVGTLLRYDLAREAGDMPRYIPGDYHDRAYDTIRDSLRALETARIPDALLVMNVEGKAIYNNRVHEGQWHQPPKALQLFDAAREYIPTSRALVDSALRWETLVQRLAGDPSVPREVASQTLTWRNEAVGRAEQDPDAQSLLAWAREAEAFRTMRRDQFLREFPHQAKAVERFEQAIAESEKYPEAEAHRFIAIARARIADRVERGDFLAKGSARAQQRDRDDRTR